MVVNFKSRESDGVRGILNSVPADRERLLPPAGRLVPLSPAPTGLYSKMATITNPEIKKALFSVIDKFFITIQIIRSKANIVKKGITA